MASDNKARGPTCSFIPFIPTEGLRRAGCWASLRDAAENKAGTIPGEVTISLGEALKKLAAQNIKTKGQCVARGPLSGLRDQGAQAGISQPLPARPRGHVN